MIFRCYNGRLPAHALPLFGHVILPVRRYVVQHILQTVELVMVEYTDSVYGYLLRGNPAVGNVGFAHRAAAVRMDGTEVGVHRFRLFFGRVRCCPSVLDVVNHSADRICQYRVVPCYDGYQILFPHNSCFACKELGLCFLPLRKASSRLLNSSSLPVPDVPPCSIHPMISSSKK